MTQSPDELLRAMETLAALAHPYPHASKPTKPRQTTDFGEQKYQLLLEQIPAVTFSADLQGGLSDLYVSPQIERLLGFTRAEWLEDPVRWYRQLHEDDRARWNVDFAEVVTSARAFEGVYRFRAKNGRVVWVQGAVNFIRDEADRPRFLQGIAFDITEIKDSEEKTRQAERVLREAKANLEREVEQRTRELQRELTERRKAEERFRMAVEASPSAMMVADQAGTILLVNRQLEELLHYDSGELIGMQVEALVPERYRGQHAILRRNYHCAPTTRRVGQGRDLFGVCKDGREVPIEIGLTPVHAADGWIVIGAIVDITQRLEKEALLRHQAESLQRSNRDLEAFARVVSHDLQAPLRKVNNFAILLSEAVNNREAADLEKYLSRILESAARMRALISDLLTYSRVSSSTEPEEVDLNVIIDEITSDLGSQIEETGAQISCGRLPVVTIRRVHMRQLFQNLIGNAIKYRRPGVAPRIEVSMAVESGQLRGDVSDNGIGIPPEMAAKVFKVFERLHTAEEYEGTGIGLAIVKKIVELYGGDATVEPNHPVGSRFKLWMQLS